MIDFNLLVFLSIKKSPPWDQINCHSNRWKPFFFLFSLVLILNLRFIFMTGKRVLTKFILVQACSKLDEVRFLALEYTSICRFPCDLGPYRCLFVKWNCKMCSWKDSIRGESGVVRPECDENALKNQSAWKCYPAPLAQVEEAGWILLESTAARELLKKKENRNKY